MKISPIDIAALNGELPDGHMCGQAWIYTGSPFAVEGSRTGDVADRTIPGASVSTAQAGVLAEPQGQAPDQARIERGRDCGDQGEG